MKIKPIRWVQTTNIVNYLGTVEGFFGIEFRIYSRELGMGFSEMPIGGRAEGIEGFFDSLGPSGKLIRLFLPERCEGTTIGLGPGYIAGNTVGEVRDFLDYCFQQWVMNFFEQEPEVFVSPRSRYDIVKDNNG